MAANSFITLEIPQEYIGKTIKFGDVKPMKQKIVDIGESGFAKNNASVIPVEEITLTKKYITIFNHWDSYTLVDILPKAFPNIEDVLNLISLGFCSFITEKEVAPYICRDKGNFFKWDEVKPQQFDLFDEIPLESFNFMYSNGKWHFTED